MECKLYRKNLIIIHINGITTLKEVSKGAEKLPDPRLNIRVIQVLR